eukprot:EG_transcript_20208
MTKRRVNEGESLVNVKDGVHQRRPEQRLGWKTLFLLFTFLSVMLFVMSLTFMHAGSHWTVIPSGFGVLGLLMWSVFCWIITPETISLIADRLEELLQQKSVTRNQGT